MADHAYLLAPEHEEFRDSMLAFGRDRFYDGYLERALKHELPRAELKELAGQGLLRLRVPEKLGGQGADVLAYGLACEALSYSDINVAFLMFGANTVACMFAEHASEAVTRKWVPAIIAGDTVGALGLTEPGSGSDAAGMTTRATRCEGGWRLSGEKTSITLASDAGVIVIVAKTDDPGKPEGMGAFVVEADSPGVSTSTFVDPGSRPVRRGAVFLDNVFVSDEFVINAGAGGFGLVMHEFDLTRTVLGLMCVGAAQRALDMAIDYVKIRTSFGQPLATYQGVSLPIAEHTTYLEAVRTLGYHTLCLREAGKPHTAQAAMLKWWGPVVAFNAIQEAVLLHGNVGYDDGMPLQSLLRDVSGYQIGDGTAQIQKLVIARETIGREVMPRRPA